MKILIISNSTMGKNGWSAYTKLLTNELINEGHNIFFANSLGEPLQYFTNPFIAIIKARAIKKLIKNLQPDIIHITVEPYSAILPILGKKIASKTILTIHGSYGIRMLQGFINKKRSKWILQNIGGYICVSNYTKIRVTQEIEICMGKDAATIFKNKSHVIPNGIHINHSISQPENTTKQILCVGGVKPRKGILESLQALAKYIKDIDHEVHMTIVGSYDPDNTYMQKLQNFIVSQRLSTHVSFTGAISDEALHKLYTQADLYLMPAKTTHDAFEGFGLAYIEAASYGIPCIGTNDSGAAEAIKESISGYKCNPQESSAIAHAMEKVLLQGSINRVKCNEWAGKHSVSIMTRKTLEVYYSL